MDAISILLVDDNSNNLDLLRSTIKSIQRYELNILIATDGKRALEIIDKKKPDLILLDVMMPIMNGFEVCQEVRKQYNIDEMPIIFVTAKDEDIDLGFEYGGNDYIVKPISTAEVIARTEHQIKLILLSKKLKDANENLEAKVRERTSELAITNRQLREEIKERRYMQDRLAYLATHDFVTHLYNRNALDDHITNIISRVLLHKEKAIFLQLDLDRFRVVNETCGCFAGDELLRQFSEMLRSYLAPEDFVARLGGDKFAIVCVNMGLDEAKLLSKRIHEQLKNFHFIWDERVFTIGAAIAIVEVDENAISFDNVMLMADEVIYHLKKDKFSTLVFSEITDAPSSTRSCKNIAIKIMDSIKQGNMQVYAQKIVCQSTSVVNAKPKLEMLVRMWDEAQGRLIYPDEFIHVAERFNLIADVDKWVIEETLKLLSEIKDVEARLSSVCINISALTIRDVSVLGHIKNCIDKYRINPSLLCFELTETEAVVNMDSANNFIDKLHDLGCKFALDDFGSGFCSFNYLKDLSFDFVKIDGIFIKDMLTNESHRLMVKSIIEIAQQMKKAVVAEFVEDERILQVVKDMNIEWAQGFHLHKPQALGQLLQCLEC